MTTAPTNNRPSREERQAPPRHIDRVPMKRRKWRALWTVVSLIVCVLAAGWTAVALGLGDSGQMYAALFLLLTGALSAWAAQQTGWYTGEPVLPSWLRRTREADTGRDGVSTPARTGTKQHVGPPVQRRPRPVPGPEFKARAAEGRRPSGPVPAPDLGVNFAYIVTLVRRLVEKGDTGRLAGMARYYDAIDWDFEEDDPRSYQGAVQLVRNIATELPFFVPRGHANYDATDVRNAEVFLAELDNISGAAAAVAALMLVRDDQDVTGEVFDAVMTPWVQEHLPYRMDNIKHAWVPAQKGYRPFEIEGAAPPIPVIVHPDDLVGQRQAPAPASAARPSPPPAPAPSLEVDPDAEDEQGLTVNLVLQGLQLVVSSQFGSTQMLGRKLRIGFALAGHLMDRLSRYGIVGEPEGAKARQVLVRPDELDDALAEIRGYEIQRRQAR